MITKKQLHLSKFFSRLLSDRDNEVDIVKIMKERANLDNELKPIVKELRLNRKSLFE
jgi:hypothetical protein